MNISDVEEVLSRATRSADRANIETMLRKLRKGAVLNYQERMNLFAYFNRYGVQTFNTERR